MGCGEKVRRLDEHGDFRLEDDRGGCHDRGVCGEGREQLGKARESFGGFEESTEEPLAKDMVFGIMQSIGQG